MGEGKIIEPPLNAVFAFGGGQGGGMHFALHSVQLTAKTVPNNRIRQATGIQTRSRAWTPRAGTGTIAKGARKSFFGANGVLFHDEGCGDF